MGGSAARAQTAAPPPNLARLVAHRETETEAERNQYMYRQSVTLDELDATARPVGSTGRCAT